jgi:hypothetical protein
MISKPFTLLLSVLFTLLVLSRCSCKKNGEDVDTPLAIKARNHLWVTYYYERNGLPDNAVVSQKPTFDFRTDGNLYFSQINPVFKDTLAYQFTNGDDKLVFSRYPISMTQRLTFTVSKITDTEFYFTVQETGSNNINLYKTRAQ